MRSKHHESKYIYIFIYKISPKQCYIIFFCFLLHTRLFGYMVCACIQDLQLYFIQFIYLSILCTLHSL